ncbi:MAG: signal peptidase [Frankiaceae bacterium]|jgi:signal peptidase II|nr:signal peptidase [Frankiaceae bacterium]
MGSLLVVAAVVLVADVVSKVLVVANVRPNGAQHIRLLGHYLQITNTRNSGAAFSVGTRATVVFTAVAVVVAAVILRAAARLRSRGWAVCLGLLLGGALGNLSDRVFRAPGVFRGEVVDWLQLPHWPVFNLADSAIVVGGVVAVLLASRGIPLEGRPATEEPAGA